MSQLNVALVGCPNAGKSTLFNELTKSRQKTGNYPGVTVEKREGLLQDSGSSGQTLRLLDLPGIYNLSGNYKKSPGEALDNETDEAVTLSILLGDAPSGSSDSPDILLAIADRTQLARHLYLVTQLRDLGLPLVLAITMMDQEESGSLDLKKLSAQLGMPVFAISSRTRTGIAELVVGLMKIAADLGKAQELPVSARQKNNFLPETEDVIAARYQFIDKTLTSCAQKPSQERRLFSRAWQDRIDGLLLHRILGPIFLLVIFATFFQIIFSLAQFPMEALSGLCDSAGAWIKQNYLSLFPAAGWGAFFGTPLLRDFIADGLIAGVGSVIVFLPQILILFFFLTLLEDSGYLARAAFILDRIFSGFGMSGKSFVPLLSSFACAVPGIMATRTIPSKRERLITILVAPLMTCSARLPVYTLFIATFVPPTPLADFPVLRFFTLQSMVMLALYFSGVFASLLISLLFSKSILKGDISAFMMELPSYQWPQLRNLLTTLLERSRIFLTKAGTTILVISVILWTLSYFPASMGSWTPDSLSRQAPSLRLEQSILGQIGHKIEPVFKPLGFDWKITIGVLTSFAAREVLVSTLSTLYAAESGPDSGPPLGERLRNATSPEGVSIFSLPVVLSILVFYMLACQCISTLAITKRETNSWRWPLFMFSYMTLFAYVAALITFHVTKIWTG